MKTALIISFVIFLGYLLFTLLNPYVRRYDGKVATSISETYYLLQDTCRGGFLFTLLFIFVVPFGILPYLFENTPNSFQFLGFLTAMGIMFVGAAPLFKGHESKIHTISAVLAAVSALAWAIAMHQWMMWIGYTLVFAIIGYWRGCIKTHIVLFGELVAFLSTYTILLTL